MKVKSKPINQLAARKRLEKLGRLKAINERVRGTFRDFMTQEDLKVMREDAKWKREL